MLGNSLGWLATLCGAVSAGLLGHVACRVQPAPLPVAGQRGRMRRLALQDGHLLRRLDPALRYFSLPIRRAPVGKLRERIETWLDQSGHPLGLGADELLVLCALSSAILAVASHVGGLAQLTGPVAPLWAAGIGAVLPLARLHEHLRARQHRIVRTLPEAIDLTSLCMNAGLDFQGALALLVRVTPDRRNPLIVELERVLEALQLGHTRRAALAALAERVPVSAVQDLVTAVTLAEQKGTPLASVLEIQAGMLRLRRSVLSEERAARAATLLAFPLLLMLGSVLLLLFGPFLVGGLGF